MGQLLTDAEAGKLELVTSAINMGEVFYMTVRKRSLQAAERGHKDILDAPVTIEEAPLARVLAAARIKSRHAMSYADAFAAALALELSAEVATGDAELAPLVAAEGLKVRWLRQV